MPFSIHHIRWFMVLMCLVTCDVNSDHLGKVVSGRFLHRNATVFLLVMSKHFVGKYFRIMQISCFASYFHPLILALTDGTCLQQLALYCLPNMIFYFLLHLLIEILLQGRAVPSPPINRIICVCMDSLIFILFHGL